MRKHIAIAAIKKSFMLIVLLTPALLQAQTGVNHYNQFLKESNQVLFVRVAEWNATHGSMQLYQRTNDGSPWQLVQQFPVTVGRNGLGYDKHTMLPKLPAAAEKQEGDGKSPAGIFKLGPVFSYHALQGLQMPFKQVDTTDICVDDVHSIYYNTLVGTDTATRKDWNSFEHMKASDDAYEYGVWVQYNSDKIFAGNGSCIFLHVWGGANSHTAGCTAMEKENIIALIHWLDSKKHPVLLQVVEKD